jgi:hypothetical protein
MLRHCKHCGKILENHQKKYCSDCSLIAKKQQQNKRAKRYREKHNNENVKKWNALHPEEKKLIQRTNYYKDINATREKNRKKMREWRAKNPLLERETRARQNKRKQFLKKHNIRAMGIRPKIITVKGTKNCLSCNKPVEYGISNIPRKYCDSCYKKNILESKRKAYIKFNKKHPNYQKENYRQNHGIIVASTCVICNEIIIYKGLGLVPYLCEFCATRRATNGNKRRNKEKIQPKNPIDFIQYEKRRLGLHLAKKWTKREINKVYAYWQNQQQPLQAVSED